MGKTQKDKNHERGKSPKEESWKETRTVILELSKVLSIQSTCLPSLCPGGVEIETESEENGIEFKVK